MHPGIVKQGVTFLSRGSDAYFHTFLHLPSLRTQVEATKFNIVYDIMISGDRNSATYCIGF